LVVTGSERVWPIVWCGGEGEECHERGVGRVVGVVVCRCRRAEGRRGNVTGAEKGRSEVLCSSCLGAWSQSRRGLRVRSAHRAR